MLFSSPVFFVFFAVYFALHRLLPRAQGLCLIIAGSTIFYACWRVEYVWLPYLLASIAFLGVLWLDKADDDATRKRRTMATVVALLLPLAIVKYTDFLFRDVIGPLAGFQTKLLDWPLPLGISFVTFTLVAYVVDVHRRQFQRAESFPIVLAHVLFFPHLIAGPILRPRELIPQLARLRRPMSLHPTAAVAIFTMGLVKKLVFADEIATVVDAAYANTAGISAGEALLAIYGFSLQIYCDFSGYTDMAIGLAMLLGIRLPNNFFRPYGAGSIVEFWRRWHVTLSFWIRDYVYIPLGGSRRGRTRTALNVLIAMGLAGLWHGANWTFVIWGALHGAAVAGEHLMGGGTRAVTRLPRWLGILLTFHFVTVTWVFFRAPTVAHAWSMLTAAFAGPWTGSGALLAGHGFHVLLIAAFIALHRFDDHRRVHAATRRFGPEIVWPAVGGLWILAIAVSQGSSAKFIYFDF